MPATTANKIKLKVAQGDTNKVDINPKTFTAGETNLTLIGKNTAGIATIEAVLTSDESQVVARLKVHVFEERTVSVGIYRVTDPNSPDTAPVAAANSAAIIATLDDVFKQCGIRFTNAVNAEAERAYDVDPQDGRYNDTTAERNGLLLETFNQGQLRLILIKNSGIVYPENQNAYVRATNLERISLLFVTQCGEHLSIIAAHEIGHALGLSTKNNAGDNENHDEGPYPEGTISLMQAGRDAQGNIRPHPGRWLRQEDWKLANTKAGRLP
jgi:hypothetical protein